MEREILLIGQTKRFMVKSLSDGLTGAGYQVRLISPDIKEISETPEGICVYLLFLDEDYPEELFVYLRDIIKDKKISLFLIGEKSEIDNVYDTMRDSIMDSFKRPLNVTAVAGRLDEEFARREKRQAMKKILVIDDDSEMLYSLEEILSEKFCVFMANSGMNGISFLVNEKVDLILLDYEMPVLNGPKIMEMLKSEPQTSNIPVMFLTGHGDKESVMSVIKFKPVGYLLKSLPAQELIETIEKFFAEKDSEI